MPSSRYVFGTLPWYSVLIVLGICAALFIASREEKRLRLPADTVIDLALSVIPLGIIGARLYYVAFAWDMFRSNPISILYVWNGGLAIYGGLIGGLIAVLLFAWRKKLPVLTLFDMIVPGVALAQAIGRWGNFFNMEAYGVPVTSSAWQFFPAAVLIPEASGSVWHLATFFYESMWNLAVFGVLMLLRGRASARPGSQFCWYLLLYGSGRLVIEGLRMDSLMTTGGNGRVSQLLSVALCLLVLVIFLLRILRRTRFQQWLFGLFAGAFALMINLLIPQPQEAFFLAHPIWFLLSAVVAAASVILLCASSFSDRRRIAGLLPLCLWVLSMIVRTTLAHAHIDGIGADTLLCALFSVTVIGCGACLYPVPASSRTAADRKL